MVWSQFSINILGLHFGNSLLDNYNWEKIRHSLTKHSVTLFGMKKKKKKKEILTKYLVQKSFKEEIEKTIAQISIESVD